MTNRETTVVFESKRTSKTELRNLWIARLFGFDKIWKFKQNDSVKIEERESNKFVISPLTKMEDGPDEYRTIIYGEKYNTFDAWLNVKTGLWQKYPKGTSEGVGLILTDGKPNSSGFQNIFLTKKDNLHPLKSFCGKWGFIGGSCDSPEEAPQTAITRELFEEIKDMDTVNSILFRMNFYKRVVLNYTDNQNNVGTYALNLFEARTGDDFQNLAMSILTGGVAEATAYITNVDGLKSLIDDDLFLGGQGPVISEYITR